MTLILYTRSDCRTCPQVKAALTKRGIAYEERDADDPANMAAMKAKGITSVPALVKGRHKPYVGYSPAGLDEWLRKVGVT
ncbi:MAG: glutaredoxin family protein [Pseudomonadota bacterium]